LRSKVRRLQPAHPLAFAAFPCISRLIKHPAVGWWLYGRPVSSLKPFGTTGFRLPVSPLSTVTDQTLFLLRGLARK
jgi:hypothetical protein